MVTPLKVPTATSARADLTVSHGSGGSGPGGISTNLAAWYDASNAASITASAGRVSQWADLSTNNRHLIQATGTVQPLTGSHTKNGLNVLYLAVARNDHMQTASSFTVTAPGTLYVVANVQNGPGSQGNVIDGFNSSGNRWVLGNHVGDNKINLYDSTAERQITTTWAAWHLITVNYATGQTVIRVDGVNQTLNTAMGTIPNYIGLDLGWWAGGSGWVEMDVAEIALYQGTHTTETATIEAAFRTKWATP